MLSLLSTSAKVSVDDNFSLLQTVNYYTVEPQNVRSQEVVSYKSQTVEVFTKGSPGTSTFSIECIACNI